MFANLLGKQKHMMTDPIADMLTRIRNASAVRKGEIVLPYSKVKHAIAQLLSQEGFVGAVEKVDNGTKPLLSIELLYVSGQSRITTITRASKPGLRVYVKKEDIPTVCNSYGVAILSTSRGMMTSETAKEEHIGGELICTIY